MKRVLILIIGILLTGKMALAATITADDKRAVSIYFDYHKKQYLKKTKELYNRCKKSCQNVKFQAKPLTIEPQTIKIKLKGGVFQKLPSLKGNVAIKDYQIGLDAVDFIEVPTSKGHTYLHSVRRYNNLVTRRFLRLFFKGRVVKIEPDINYSENERNGCWFYYRQKELYKGSLVPYLINGAISLKLPAGFKIAPEFSTNEYLAIIPTPKVRNTGEYHFEATAKIPVINEDAFRKCDCKRCEQEFKTLKPVILKDKSFYRKFNFIKIVDIDLPSDYLIEARPCKVGSKDVCLFNAQKKKISERTSFSLDIPLQVQLDKDKKVRVSYSEDRYGYPKKDTFVFNLKKYFGEVNADLNGYGEITIEPEEGTVAEIEVSTRGGEFKKTIKLGRPHFYFRLKDAHLVEKATYKGGVRYYAVKLASDIAVEVIGEGVVFPEDYQLICETPKGLQPVSQTARFSKIGAYKVKAVCRYKIPEATIKHFLTEWASKRQLPEYYKFTPTVVLKGGNFNLKKKFYVRLSEPDIKQVRTVFKEVKNSKPTQRMDAFITSDGKRSSYIGVYGELVLANGQTVDIPATNKNFEIKTSKGLYKQFWHYYKVKDAHLAGKDLSVTVSYKTSDGKIIKGTPAYIKVNKVLLLQTGDRRYVLMMEGSPRIRGYKVKWVWSTKDFHFYERATGFNNRAGQLVSEIELPTQTVLKTLWAHLTKPSGETILTLTTTDTSNFYFVKFIGDIEGPSIMKAGNKYKVTIRFKANLPKKEMMKGLKCVWEVKGEGIGIASLGNPEILPDGRGKCSALVYVEKGKPRLADITVKLIGK